MDYPDPVAFPLACAIDADEDICAVCRRETTDPALLSTYELTCQRDGCDDLDPDCTELGHGWHGLCICFHCLTTPFNQAATDIMQWYADALRPAAVPA